MDTPCIKVCKLKEGKCIGCLRTVDQITNWTKYSQDQRETIMKELNSGPTAAQG